MAQNATIFKADIQISDLNRHHYELHSLTLARHPSETDERMMVRLMAFMLYADEQLLFSKGLSAEGEPDVWHKDLTGHILRWIYVGLPDEKWLRKAAGRSDAVVVIAYGGNTAKMWWKKNGDALANIKQLTVLELTKQDSEALAGLADRNMQLQVTIEGNTLWLSTDTAALEITPDVLLSQT
jgi:uncharacterized protein YaeQ